MPTQVDTKADKWTYGAEHELADWNCKHPMLQGFARSPDHTVVNSNGIAAQPNVKMYSYGGEINTPPTDTILGQVGCLRDIRFHWQDVVVNHRSNLHIHIRVPGLKDSLNHLKQVQQYIHLQLRSIIDKVEPIPEGTTPAEKKRAKRRKVSHHTFLTEKRITNQLSAKSLDEFFKREVPRDSTGRAMWHAQPRVCVNLRQLLQTDTVEFRHFPGTLDSSLFHSCVSWCRSFMLAALSGAPIKLILEGHKDPFPSFPEFDEEREIRYQATAAKGNLSPMEIKTNIDLILKGKFNAQDSPEAYRKAQEAAGVVPR